tara:strand:- start:1090 stop:2334 length:1245 start_codon:yes stop_codon:yes gene_type:complete
MIQENCEGLISLLTGITIPRPINLKIIDHGYKLLDSDAKILKSIAKQLSKGIPLTDRQYNLVITKLENYRDQFLNKGINIDHYKDKLMYPLREIDRSHFLKFDEEEKLVIRFPFNRKIIDRIEEVRRVDPISHSYGDNIHKFSYSPQTLVKLVEIAHKFEYKFEVDKNIKDIYERCILFESSKEKYVPGIYDYKIKNIPDTVKDILLSEIGECNEDTLPLYYDRRELFGLKYFDMAKISQSYAKLSVLTNKIIQRKDPTIVLQSKTHTIDQLIQSLVELKRFPLLIVLNEKNALDELTVCYNHFRNIISNDKISVCFRKPNTDERDPFNLMVSEKGLNNPVDKYSQIVYINNSKLPKPLLQKGFSPRAIISFGGKSLNFNNVTNYIQQFDLQIVYEDDSSSVYWNKRLRKVINA